VRDDPTALLAHVSGLRLPAGGARGLDDGDAEAFGGLTLV
jgi:hypothetical protein